jgi:hypothetical protein
MGSREQTLRARGQRLSHASASRRLRGFTQRRRALLTHVRRDPSELRAAADAALELIRTAATVDLGGRPSSA